MSSRTTFSIICILFILACTQNHHKEKAVGKLLNGKREGTWKFYYPNGKIKEIADYKADSFHGKRIAYYENGNIYTSAHYNMGVFVDSFFLYFNNGQLRSECWFDSSGKAQGIYKIYYETGEISLIGRSVDNMDVDTARGFYKNKQLSYLIPYKNGKIEGALLYFDEDGKIVKKEIYKNDSLIK